MGLLALLGGAGAGASLNLTGKDFDLTMNPGWSISGLGKDLNYPAAVFAVAALLVAAFMIWMTIALWHGRKWSLWFIFLTHLPAALIGGFSRDFGPSAIGLAVTIYTFLRITGNAGPKL